MLNRITWTICLEYDMPTTLFYFVFFRAWKILVDGVIEQFNFLSGHKRVTSHFGTLLYMCVLCMYWQNRIFWKRNEWWRMNKEQPCFLVGTFGQIICVKMYETFKICRNFSRISHHSILTLSVMNLWITVKWNCHLFLHCIASNRKSPGYGWRTNCIFDPCQ